MASNSDPHLVNVLTEQELGNNTAPAAEPPEMQVATRKETSSGFMLLSVKHLSKLKKEKVSCVSMTNGGHPQEECFNDTCSAKVSMNMAARGNTFGVDRQFSSTASLDAEEYEDDDEDEIGGTNNYQNVVLQQGAPLLMPSCQPNHHAGVGLSQVTNTERFTNRPHQSVDVTPAAISNIHLALQKQPQLRPVNGWTFSNNAQMSNSIAQSVYDIPAQVAHEPLHHNHYNQSTLFRQIRTETCIGTPIEVPTPSAFPPKEVPPHFPGAGQVPVFKHSDPSFDVPASVAARLFVSNQLQDFTQPPSQASVLQQLHQNSGEPPRSASMISPLNRPIQTASRFRKARIRETVEQWGSNRLSCHDCRLKAVPNWVSDLQATTADPPFNNPIIHRGRCLYCFAPGHLGSQCAKHRKQAKQSKNRSFPIDSTSDSPEVSGLLQATFMAYNAANAQGFNLASMLAAWEDGKRVANQDLLIGAELFSNNYMTPAIDLTVTGGGLKTNASEPAFLIDHNQTTATGGLMAPYTAAHNSTEVPTDCFAVANGEYTAEEGLTLVARQSGQHQISLADQSGVLAPLQVTTGAPEGFETTTISATTRPVNDPSTAYLRRHLTHCMEEVTPPCPIAPQDSCNTLPPFPPSHPPAAAVDTQLATSPTTPVAVGVGGGAESWNQAMTTMHPPLQPIPSTPSVAVTATNPRLLVPHPISISNTTVTTSASPSPDPDLVPLTVTAGGCGVDLHGGGRMNPMLDTRTLTRCESDICQATGLMVAHRAMNYLVTEPRAFSVGPPGLVTSGDPIRSAAAQSSSSPSQPPPQSTSSDIGAPTSTATANDQQRIQQQLLQHQAHAAAVAALAASQQQSVSQLPCGAGGGVANATPEQIDAATPRCLDAIRDAIMITVHDQFNHISLENEALRQAVSNLQHEIQVLQTYKHAFYDLRPFFKQPELWDQIEAQVRLHATDHHHHRQQQQHQIHQQMQRQLQPTTSQAQQHQHFFAVTRGTQPTAPAPPIPGSSALQELHNHHHQLQSHHQQQQP